MVDLIYSLPLVVVGSALIAGLCLFGLGGLLLVRRLVLPRLRVRAEDSEFSGAMVQAIMVFYGLAVALIAVSVWQSYSDAGKMVSQEAANLAALYRDVSLYPEPHRSALQKDVKDYLEFVIHEAWPKQRRGESAVAPPDLVRRMLRDFSGFEPSSEREKLQHGEALRALNEAIVATRLRVDAASGGLPMVLWTVVIVGAVLSLSSCFFFKVEDARLHAILLSLLAAFIGLVIFMILALDRPFRGDLGVRPDAYQLVLDQLINSSSPPSSSKSTPSD